MTAPNEGVRLVDHARAELERLGEFTPGTGDPAYAQALVAAVAAYTSYPHSGFSHAHGHDILIRLLARENLTPLTWDPADWYDRTDVSDLPPGQTLWQSTRNPKAFSGDQGKTYWLTDGDSSGEHNRDLTYYRSVAPGIPPFRQDPNPLPPPIGEDRRCTQVGEVTVTALVEPVDPAAGPDNEERP